MERSTEEAGFLIRAAGLLSAAGICLVAGLCNVPAAYADTALEKQAEAQSALQSLNTMMSNLDDANTQYAAALSAQQDAQQQMDEAQSAIDDQTEKIHACQEKLAHRACGMYRAGETTFLDVLFGAASFQDFAASWDLLSTMNSRDAQLVADTKDARIQLEASKQQYADQEQIAAQKSDEARSIRDQANQMAQQMQQTYVSLNDQAIQLAAQEQAAAQADTHVQEQAVSTDQIVDFDETTGYATLADGRTARVVGYDSATGNAIVDMAMAFVGGSYHYGSEDASSHTFDCSGLVQYVYGLGGIKVGGHNDRAILDAGTVVDDPQPGDICWWDGHVAIYAGNGMMISADNEQYGITYRAVSPGATYVRY